MHDRWPAVHHILKHPTRPLQKGDHVESEQKVIQAPLFCNPTICIKTTCPSVPAPALSGAGGLSRWPWLIFPRRREPMSIRFGGYPVLTENRITVGESHRWLVLHAPILNLARTRRTEGEGEGEGGFSPSERILGHVSQLDIPTWVSTE